jgi:hypothetical protein
VRRILTLVGKTTVQHGQSVSSTVAELAGAGLVAYGVGLIYQPAGVIVAGLLAVAAGWLVGDGR